MWTFHEIQRLNPPGPGQKDSILSLILRLNAATPDLLCQAAEELDELGPPYICCFAQLPFPVFVESADYPVKADTKDVVMRLRLSLVEANVDAHGLDLKPLPSEAATTTATSYVTQILGFIPLWATHYLLQEPRRLSAC